MKAPRVQKNSVRRTLKEIDALRGNSKTDDKEREILKLKAKVLSLEQQNKLLYEKYGAIKSRHEIIRELKYLIKSTINRNYESL